MRNKLFIIWWLATLSCNNSDSKIQSKRNINDSSEKIAVVQSDDFKMNEAISNAKESYPEFLSAFEDKCNSCKNFSVKMRFDYGQGNGEHIWLTDLHFKNNRLAGIINNIPENIDWVKLGDTIEIKKDLMSDWMYVKGDEMVGGFTIRVLYNKMNEDEKKQLENDLGAKIR